MTLKDLRDAMSIASPTPWKAVSTESEVVCPGLVTHYVVHEQGEVGVLKKGRDARAVAELGSMWPKLDSFIRAYDLLTLRRRAYEELVQSRNILERKIALFDDLVGPHERSREATLLRVTIEAADEAHRRLVEAQVVVTTVRAALDETAESSSVGSRGA